VRLTSTRRLARLDARNSKILETREAGLVGSDEHQMVDASDGRQMITIVNWLGKVIGAGAGSRTQMSLRLRGF